MQSLVILSVLGCAFAAPFLQDTPEVVAARARFTQLYNAQAAAAAAAPDDPHHAAPAPSTPRRAPAPAPAQPFSFSSAFAHQPSTFTFSSSAPQPAAAPVLHAQPAPVVIAKWTGPVAATIPAGVQGSLAQVPETADVMAARTQFLNTFRAQLAAVTPAQTSAPTPAPAPRAPVFVANALPAPVQKWSGPVAATVSAGVSGPVVPVGESADVSAARRSFEAAYQAALARTAPSGVVSQSLVFQTGTQPASHVQPAVARWSGPVAATVPASLPGSAVQVADTADVAAAVAAFQQAYNEAVARTTGRRV